MASSEGAPPNKIRRLNGQSSQYTSANYDQAVKKALEDLDNCQNEIDDLNENCSEEILQIEQKYNKLRRPLFKKRDNLINTIPNFWVTAFLNNSDINIFVDEVEEDILHHLNRIEVEENEDIKSGYKLKFHFEENPYFHNSVLVKEYMLGTDNPFSQSTVVNWKDGVSLPKAEACSSKGRKRNLESKTFFSWFVNNDDPFGDDIAEYIKDDLWQNPLQYYLVPDAEDETAIEELEESDSSIEMVSQDGDDRVEKETEGSTT